MQRIFSKGAAVMNRQAAEHLKDISHPSQLPAAQAVAGGSYSASVRVPNYARPTLDRMVAYCHGTGEDCGALMGILLAVAVRDYLDIKGVQ